MNYLIVIIGTTALFLAMIMALALKTKTSVRVSQIILVVSIIGGLFYYGYGYAETMGSPGMAVIKATLSVCGMFVGKNDWSAVSETKLFESFAAQAGFWILHLMALYSTASAAIATIGASALRELRLFMIRKGNLVLIYGVNQDTLTLGRELNAKKNVSILYVADHPAGDIVATIGGMGCIVRSDKDALEVTESFLGSIGLNGFYAGKRAVVVYALDKDSEKNVRYARLCINGFQEAGLSASQTKLVLHCSDESIGESLVVLAGENETELVRCGFGSVYCFNEADLAARALIRQFPPCNYVEFDEHAMAKSDFDAVIVGFGKIGQAVLKQLVMNGQFPGSRFHVAVVAPDCKNVSGYIWNTCPEIFRQYDIEMLPIDARSSEFYEYLGMHKDTLKYMAICSGTEKMNAELMENLARYAEQSGCRMEIFQCHYNGIKYTRLSDHTSLNWNIYRNDLLAPEKRDTLAMLLNDYYEGNSLTAPEKSWGRCSYFNKLSSCAAAEAISTYLKMAGLEAKSVLRDGLSLTEQQLETLGVAEHLRWCAFHYVMGYSLMPETVYEERVKQFQQIKASQGIQEARKFKLSKDSERRLHTCLVPWEELDRVTEEEKAVTGKESLDYKQYDKNNVLLMENLLEAKSKLE